MILIVDFGSQKSPNIAEAVDETCDFHLVKDEQFEPDMLKNCKGVILSGAPILVTEVDLRPYIEKYGWIKETTLPVLGICFGHQLIGILHGSFASRMKEDRDWQEIEVYQEDEPLFSALPREVKMMEDHCETISVPNEFELIASSDACVNEAMRHTKKTIYGVQFHPEVSGNMGFRLIENFCKMCLAHEGL